MLPSLQLKCSGWPETQNQTAGMSPTPQRKLIQVCSGIDRCVSQEIFLTGCATVTPGKEKAWGKGQMHQRRWHLDSCWSLDSVDKREKIWESCWVWCYLNEGNSWKWGNLFLLFLSWNSFRETDCPTFFVNEQDHFKRLLNPQPCFLSCMKNLQRPWPSR